MFRVKKLYLFILRSFLPVFVMTFFICLFIVLMQFLWRYIDDLVGKGLEISVIGELFFYAALTMVPMALPLAVLLASLMTFGNLGEKFELTAMKAAGVSLLKTMRPLILLISLIAVGAFFFQNDVLPKAQTKMWTLLFSMRQKSPEMEIPEKAFYDQIPGFNFYVDVKNKINGDLYDVVIYDVSQGFDNSRIILADTAHLSVTDDRTHLILNLRQGEQFENLRQQNTGISARNMPFRRESFLSKNVIIPFDANFNRMDESTMRNQYVGKNIEELQATIDSINIKVDSIGKEFGQEIKENPIMELSYYETKYNGDKYTKVVRKDVKLAKPINIDSLINHNKNMSARSVAEGALQRAERIKQDYEFKGMVLADANKNMRRHAIEMHKKFTLSFACLIFFFIGAPLGAIIRKGGIGTPLVISVGLFIVYYIFDNTGYKMARDGKLDVVQGIWLSTMVLLPLGVFLTYKAIHDSAVFNADAYKMFFMKLRGRVRRNLEPKQFTLNEVNVDVALSRISDFRASLDVVVASNKGLKRYLFNKLRSFATLGQYNFRRSTRQMDDLIEYLSNTRDGRVTALLNEYPQNIKFSNLKKVALTTQSLYDYYIKEQDASAEEASIDETSAEEASIEEASIDETSTDEASPIQENE